MTDPQPREVSLSPLVLAIEVDEKGHYTLPIAGDFILIIWRVWIHEVIVIVERLTWGVMQDACRLEVGKWHPDRRGDPRLENDLRQFGIENAQNRRTVCPVRCRL